MHVAGMGGLSVPPWQRSHLRLGCPYIYVCHQHNIHNIHDKYSPAPLPPQSLIYVLEHGTPDAFSAALCGEHDTPELLWTERMRRGTLQPQVTVMYLNISIGSNYKQMSDDV